MLEVRALYTYYHHHHHHHHHHHQHHHHLSDYNTDDDTDNGCHCCLISTACCDATELVVCKSPCYHCTVVVIICKSSCSRCCYYCYHVNPTSPHISPDEGCTLRRYLWYNLYTCTLYLLACPVRVIVGDSGLCCCIHITFF